MASISKEDKPVKLRRGVEDKLISFSLVFSQSTTTRIAGGLDFTAIGGKKQGREVPPSLRAKPGATHPVWKT
jgi:hypothetical protein